MRFYEVNPFIGAIVLAAIAMGLIGLLVVLPIAGIQWIWNSAVAVFTVAPEINYWQAGLLYVAFATTLYLTGLVRIEFETGLE